MSARVSERDSGDFAVHKFALKAASLSRQPLFINHIDKRGALPELLSVFDCGVSIKVQLRLMII